MAPTGQSLSIEALSRDECLHFLEGADFARVVLSVGGLPAALPARIALSESHHLVISSRESAVILAARRGDVLSVQIDGLESDGRRWSVMVSGIAAIADSEEVQTPLMQRATERGAALVTLPLSVVAGQRGD